VTRHSAFLKTHLSRRRDEFAPTIDGPGKRYRAPVGRGLRRAQSSRLPSLNPRMVQLSNFCRSSFSINLYSISPRRKRAPGVRWSCIEFSLPRQSSWRPWPDTTSWTCSPLYNTPNSGRERREQRCPDEACPLVHFHGARLWRRFQFRCCSQT
jgi:hypothetical protein